MILRTIELFYRWNSLDSKPLYLWQLNTPALQWLLFVVLCLSAFSFYFFLWRFVKKTAVVVERHIDPSGNTHLAAKTVHISNIPKSIPFQEVEEVIKQLVGMVYPGACLALVTVVPDYERLTHLQAKHNALSEKLEKVRDAKSRQLASSHSTSIGGVINFADAGILNQQKNGKKFKKLQAKEVKLFTELDTLEQLIEDEIELRSEGNTGHAFISFTSEQAARDLIDKGFHKRKLMGRQVSLSSYKYKGWVISPAVHPHEIIWENLGKPHSQGCLYRVWTYLLLLGASMGAMALIFAIDELKYFIHRYFFISLSGLLELAIKVVTPLLAYFFIWILLPKLAILLTKGELLRTRSREQSSYYRKVFLFSFLCCFLFGFLALFVIDYSFKKK